jgi:hypothetical protein
MESAVNEVISTQVATLQKELDQTIQIRNELQARLQEMQYQAVRLEGAIQSLVILSRSLETPHVNGIAPTDMSVDDDLNSQEE